MTQVSGKFWAAVWMAGMEYTAHGFGESSVGVEWFLIPNFSLFSHGFFENKILNPTQRPTKIFFQILAGKTKKQKLEEVTMNPIICIGNYRVDKKIKDGKKIAAKYENGIK